ncbi:hypothetical protein U1Q18_019670 [Sarracenia purpurea var. burkii]
MQLETLGTLNKMRCELNWYAREFAVVRMLRQFCDVDGWPVVDPLPSYGRGRDTVGGRYISLIFGTNLTDVAITGENGTIDGQGALWWKKFHKGELQYTRPYLIEIMYSNTIIISNLTLVNSPSWNVHPVYSSNIIVQSITIIAPITSPNTDGINPDSCLNTRIEDCYIVSGDDCVAVKSGWDEYGIAFAMPTKQLVIRRITCISPTSAVIALGSEMSGGIEDVRAEDILAINSESGVRIKTAVGRGGYVKDIYVRGMTMKTMKWAFWMTGDYGSHADNNYDPNAIPVIQNINYRDMVVENATMAAKLEGISGNPFTGICISNVTIELAKNSKKVPWNCSDVAGISSGVVPQPCDLLPDQGSSSSQIPDYQDLQVQRKRTSKPNPNYFSLGEGVFSDAVSSVRMFTTERNLKLGSCIHANILKSGLDGDVFISNSLLDMYAKCQHLEDAAKVFDYMPNRTVVSWTTMMSGFCQKGFLDEVLSLFLQMLETVPPNEYTLAVVLQACARKGDPRLVGFIHCFAIKYGFDRDNFFQNSLIDAYAKSGMLGTAEEVLYRLSCRDVVSWTSAISGHVGNGMMKRALSSFFRMQEDGILPNEVTILSILQACSSISEWHIFQSMHGLVLKTECSRNALVMNSLVEMYAANGSFEEAIKLFCHFCFTGEGLYLCQETMATLLQGCGHSGSFMLGEEIHGYLIKNGFLPCTSVENSLMDFYGESGQFDFAFLLFRMMSFKDIISWNTLMTCFAKRERSSEVLKLLSEIHTYHAEDNIFPDFITMLTSIQACSNLSSLRLGQVVHGYTMRAGLIFDIFVQNSLIDMYGKSGRLDFAEQIFGEMPIRDLGSWNSMIAAYGINGNGDSALQIFNELKRSVSHHPNAITFVNILSACAHAGLIEEAFEIFDRMKTEFGIDPRMEHFACMVDLLGKSGRVEEAEIFIEKMPVRPGSDVWAALLGNCALFRNVEIAERAASKLCKMVPNSDVWRVAISNVYASVGRWEDAAWARAEMRRSEELKKEGGWSSVEVKGDIHRFVVAETSYPESETIFEVLKGIREQIRDLAVTELSE